MYDYPELTVGFERLGADGLHEPTVLKMGYLYDICTMAVLPEPSFNVSTVTRSYLPERRSLQ